MRAAQPDIVDVPTENWEKVVSKIQIIKTIAKVEFKRQIDRGQELINQLTAIGSICAPQKFAEVREGQRKWSDKTDSLLKRFFEDDSLAMEYQALEIGALDENRSLLENWKSLRDALERKLTWLRNLVGRIDEFAQSERTPMPAQNIN